MNAKIESLRLARPDIAISITWEQDPHFSWDGDGPYPENDGYLPHTVEVRATQIRNGEMKTASAYLGGCYSKDGGEDDPEISGYLDQMIDEAFSEL